MNAKRKLGVLILIGGLAIMTWAFAQTAFKGDGVIQSTSGGFKFPDNSVQTTAASTGTYVIGGTGPAGGIVFHVTYDGLHGLEAAPADQTQSAWGCYNTDIVGANATALGKGARNTDDILHGCEIAPTAAAVADGYVSPSGYFDWYLPSKDELDSMHDNLHDQNPSLYGFADDYYWSSSEYDYRYAFVQYFNDGSQSETNKTNPYGVRAVRAF